MRDEEQVRGEGAAGAGRAPGGTCAEVLGRRSWSLSLEPWKSFKRKSLCLLPTPL